MQHTTRGDLMINPVNKQEELAKKWLRVVREYGTIDKWELVDRLHITVGSYYKHSSYMQHRLEPAGISFEDGFWKFATKTIQESQE